MLSRFEQENKLDEQLCKMKGEHLAQLYMRVFNTDDGLLVLRDLANRCFSDIPTVNERTEGMRDTYLSIVSRMKETTTGGKK